MNILRYFWIALAASAAASALGGAASAAPGGFVPSLELGPCARADLPAEARCGVFRVAEDPRRKPARVLDLKVIVLPARSKHPLEPVFALPGGPGAIETEHAPQLANSWLDEEHAVVMMDPRGTDPKTGLDCPAEGGRFAREAPPIYSEGDAFWRACRDRLAKRADLTRYTTPLDVEDLDALRRALGYDKIDIYGASYGTRVATAYIHAHGDHVRAALLTGVLTMSNRVPLFHAEAQQRAFDQLVAECAADAACRSAFPSVREDLTQVLDRLRREPATVGFTDEETHQPVTLKLTADSAADTIRLMLYTNESRRQIPLILHLANTGDLQPLARDVREYETGIRSEVRLGQQLSVSCAEDVWRIRPDEIAGAVGGSFMGEDRVRGEMAACALWPTARLPNSYYAPFQSSVPTVLVSGKYDPVTPPQWGEEARKTFPISIHLVARDGHANVNPCVAGIALRVFRTGSVAGIDTACMAKEKLPPFALAEDRK